MRYLISLLIVICFSPSFVFSSNPPVEYIDQYVQTNNNTVIVPTDFADAVLLDAVQLEFLKGKKIHHIDLVYTKYKSSPNFNQNALNDRRKKALLKQLPQIQSDQPTWSLVEQTGATTRKAAADYFHGFVIHYSDDLDYQSLKTFMAPYQKEFTVYNVNNANGGDLSYESGSKIHMPKYAVRFADGSEVEGMYQLRYREFRNPAEIAFSGIPMTYTEGGEKLNFNSAGMYEIRAEQNGIPLELQQAATVDFNCTDKIENLDFYALDDNSGVWEKRIPIVFDQEPDAEERIDEEAETVDQNETVWSTTTVSRDNSSTQEELLWNLSQNNESITITFNQTAWDMLEEGMIRDTSGTALIVSKDSKTRSIAAKTDDTDRLISAVNKWQGIFDIPAPQKAWEKPAIPNQVGSTLLASGMDAGHTYPKIVRGLNSPSFGVYNCDQLFRMKNVKNLSPSYVDASTGKEINAAKVACLIDHKYNGSFSFHPNTITCNPQGRNTVLLFTKKNKIYMLSEREFASSVSTSKSRPVFEMTDMTSSLKSPEDLKKVLNL